MPCIESTRASRSRARAGRRRSGLEDRARPRRRAAGDGVVECSARPVASASRVRLDRGAGSGRHQRACGGGRERHHGHAGRLGDRRSTPPPVHYDRERSRPAAGEWAGWEAAVAVSDVRSGTPGAVLGYPENGPFTIAPARVGATGPVVTQDSYGRGPITPGADCVARGGTQRQLGQVRWSKPTGR